MKFLRLSLPHLAIVTATLVTTGPVRAQPELEEVIVTALKRETTLQETPVAVSVIGGQDIDDSSIRDIRDLPLLAPSLSVTQFSSPTDVEISIRGVGTSPFNPGLEPSVGIFVDGVYRSRAGAAIGDFPIVERIEVLRGPQSTIFGKNTPAGVISIITKQPEQEFGYDGSLTLGNFASVLFKGTMTGPLGDKAAFRLSGNTSQRDGFVDNLTRSQEVNDRDRWAVRGQLLFEPNDDVSVRLIGDFSDLDEACCAAPPFLNNPANVVALGMLGANILPETPFKRDARFEGNLLTSQELWGVSTQIDWWIGWANLTSITAYRSADTSSDIDSDFIDISLSAINTNFDDYTTFTQELRLSSDNDGPFNWMLGLYYFDQDLTHDRVSTYGQSLRPFADLISGNGVTTLENILGSFRGVAPGTYFAPGNGLLSELFEQADQSFAVFGNFDYAVSDRVSLSGGLRWATEDKDIATNVVIDDEFSALNLQNIPELATLMVPVNAFAGFTPFQFFPPFENFSDSISEDNVSGTIRLSVDASDAINTYVSFSSGWKAGGFNISVGSTASSRSFRDESTRSIEIGAKGQLFDGRLITNVALFDQSIDDFQANVFNGANFDLVNAGEINIQGFELDALLEASDNVMITAAATYLDAEFDSYERASCPNALLLPTPVPPNLVTCDPTNPAFTAVQDLSGQANEGVAEWSASSTATWYFPIGGLEGFVRGEVQFSSGINLAGDQAPQKTRDDLTLFNASIGIGNPNKGWNLTLWGKNLSDEEFPQGIFDSVAQPGSLSGYPNDPPLYGLTLSINSPE